uniref:Uncharacterized protein n=1 Tax=Fervidobacterium thailandense TaxID=1008305 RepID=A0A7C5VKQ0_9BACT
MSTLFVVGAFLVVLVLLLRTLGNIDRILTKLSQSRAILTVEHVSVEGIRLRCRGKLEIVSDVPHRVEFVQLYLTDAEGNHLASWNTSALNGDDFEITIENPKLFGTKASKVKVHGFVKLDFNVGRYGLKLNLPVSSEAVISKGRD